MAWLIKNKRLNPETGTKDTYYRIGWRSEDGQTKSRALGFCTSEEAKRALKVFEGRQAAGEPVAPEPTPTEPGSSAETAPAELTLEAYMNEVYLPVIKRDKAPKTYTGASGASRALCRQLGTLRLSEVSYLKVDEYITHRKAQGRRSRTVIIELRLLKMALQHAVDTGRLTSVPKFPRIRDTDKKPHRFLMNPEAEALLQALHPDRPQPHEVTRGRPPVPRDPFTYLVVLMALNTGMRKNEMLTRGWEDIRWKQGPFGSLFVGAKPSVGFRVKTRRERVIPLTPELTAELMRTWEQAGKPTRGWIFPSPKDPSVPRQHFRQALKRACERAGIPDVHPHGLRHTWASRLAMAGVDRKTLMEVGGWQEGRVLDEIYAHVTDEHKVEVMARMGFTTEPPRREEDEDED